MQETQFFDTHCHLDSIKGHEIGEILQKARQVGVEKMVTVAYEPSHLEQLISLVQPWENVFCTQGIHPHEAHLYSDKVEEMIRSHAQREKKVVALGEMGLDYYYDHSPRDIQRQVFERQLQLACDLDFPVVIHTREADEDTLALLLNFSPRLKRKGVLHSFTSGLHLAERALAEGFYIGFNGIITFKNADNVRQVLQMVPRERVLFETDAPYLAPVPHRGKENAPFFLPYIAEKAAEVRGEERQSFFSQVIRNSHQLFGLGE